MCAGFVHRPHRLDERTKRRAWLTRQSVDHGALRTLCRSCGGSCKVMLGVKAIVARKRGARPRSARISGSASFLRIHGWRALGTLSPSVVGTIGDSPPIDRGGENGSGARVSILGVSAMPSVTRAHRMHPQATWHSRQRRPLPGDRIIPMRSADGAALPEISRRHDRRSPRNTSKTLSAPLHFRYTEPLVGAIAPTEYCRPDEAIVEWTQPESSNSLGTTRNWHARVTFGISSTTKLLAAKRRKHSNSCFTKSRGSAMNTARSTMRRSEPSASGPKPTQRRLSSDHNSIGRTRSCSGARSRRTAIPETLRCIATTILSIRSIYRSVSGRRWGTR